MSNEQEKAILSEATHRVRLEYCLRGRHGMFRFAQDDVTPVPSSSQAVFATSSGGRSYAKMQREHEDRCYHAEVKVMSLSNQQLADFQRDGVIPLGRVLSDEEVGEAQRRLRALLDSGTFEDLYADNGNGDQPHQSHFRLN